MTTDQRESGIWVPPSYSAGEKAAELDALSRSVVAESRDSNVQPGGMESLLMLATQTDDGFINWGTNPKGRDKQLRAFWISEPYVATANGVICARNAALSWTIVGHEATAEATSAMLQNANFGAGWEDFIIRVSTDLYTQDSGAFVEMVREFDSPDSAVIGINHLDAARCFPTGKAEFPIVYQDSDNKFHRMPWYSIIQLLEMPAPITPSHGGYFFRMQFCAITRFLRAAQIIKSIGIYKDEKIGGRHNSAVWALSGINRQQLIDAFNQATMIDDAAGRRRFSMPQIVTSVDPNVKVESTLLELASLPEHFDAKTELEAYIVVLAMGYLTDYQEFAPLPGGGLGTSQQSETLHQKSKGKGVGLFQSLIQRAMNLHGIIPDTVQFSFEEVDIDAEQQEAEAQKTRAETRALRILSGEISTDVAQQLALDSGDLSAELFEQGGREDLTPEVSIEDDEQQSGKALGAKAARPVKLGELINSRLHRAYSDTADDAAGLGYFDDIEGRIGVASAIGPALQTFEDEMRERGLWDIEIAPEDADRLVELSVKALAIGMKGGDDRAGTEGEERFAFERGMAEEIETALREMGRDIRRRLREEA